MLQYYNGERGALTPDDEMSGESRDEPKRCVMQWRERKYTTYQTLRRAADLRLCIPPPLQQQEAAWRRALSLQEQTFPWA